MDFSCLKQFMKSRKGVYVVSGIVGGVVLGTIAAIALSQSKPAVEADSELTFMEQSVPLEHELQTEEIQETVWAEEVVIQTEVEEAVSEEMNSEEVVNEEVSENNEEKKMTKKKTSGIEMPTVHITESEGVPLVQEIPVTQNDVNAKQKEIVDSKQQITGNNNQSTSSSSQTNSGSSNSKDNGGSGDKPSIKPEWKDEYKLVWMDDFDGAKLNTEDWNYEYHEPGWVNNELQEYVDAPENIYLKDGQLVIQAIKTVDENGKVSYTSGRVNTQNKHDYKYGRFEARAKVPSGKGFLPAFWMMPTDESFYGQWPKCGEIDIMEVLGDNITTSHGTLHFGEPHTQRQGSYVLKKGDFANEFHVFACEWEPGEIRFYVDGNLFYTEKDWFTKRPGYGEVAYPAPYDQPFYMILNLAVGGDWPGNPEPDAVFAENAQLVVDYVKVYQKDSYDENVVKPEKEEVVLSKPDETGNYVRNGKFSAKESLTDADDWQFMLAGDGKATAEIAENALHIVTTNAGALDYSVQVVQAKQSLEKGYQYRLSFDAYADEERTIITGITAPNLNYSRYMSDTKVKLTTVSENYSFTFDMTSDSDANGRVEFNLGNQGSTATVHITNVRLEKVCEIDIPEEEKTVLPDGNYVYNGEFQQGADRLDYWEVKNSCDGATVVVTNDNGNRELKATIPATVKSLDEVQVVQEPIAISSGKTYLLTFDAYADSNKSIKTMVAGKTFESELSTNKTTYRYVFETPADMKGSTLSFQIGAAGTVYLDNIRVQEDGLLVNGDFSNGTTGYEVYAYTASDVSYIVDSLNEDNAFSIDIKNTGDSDWKIQLKQNNITLEKEKWYKLSFKAKSTMDRKLMYALQKDGTVDNDWTPYSGNPIVNLTGEYQTFSKTFQMTYPTDEEVILSISMGAVDGITIDKKHTIVIDSITLEEVAEPEKDPEEGKEQEGELITNGDFANGIDGWVNAITSPGEADADFSDGKAVYTITNVGTEDWNVQLKKSGLTLEKGASYRVKMKLKSSESRIVKYAFLDPEAGYAWYGGEDLNLVAGETKEVNTAITVEQETSDKIELVISMGNINGADTPISTIEIDEVSLVKEAESVQILSLREEGVAMEETMSEGEAVTIEEDSEEITTEEKSEKEESTTEEKSEEEESTTEEKSEEEESITEEKSEEEESTTEEKSEEEESITEEKSEEEESTTKEESKKDESAVTVE